MSLPQCAVQYPSCGACGADTEHDGDSFYCDDCGLDYGNGEDGNEATFRDEEQPPCAKPCNNNWHTTPSFDLACESCKLPANHNGDCWTDCKEKR